MKKTASLQAEASLLSPPTPPKSGFKESWGSLIGSGRNLAIANTLTNFQQNALIITHSMSAAERLHQDISLFLEDIPNAPTIHLFADWETLPYDSFSPHQDIISDRMRCLYELANNQHTCVIVSAQTLLQRLIPTNYIQSKSLVVNTGQTFDRDQLQNTLIASGYNRVDTVFQHGEFAVRGSLLDVFPMGNEQAFRLELFDNEIDTLREFDPETQRTIRVVDKIELLPGKECPLDSSAIAKFKENWHNEFNVDHRACSVYQEVSSGVTPAGVEYYLPLFFEQTANLFSYLPQNAVVFTIGDIEKSFEEFWREITNRHQNRSGNLQRPILSPEKLFLPINEVFSALKPFSRITLKEEQLEQKQGNHNFDCSPSPLIALESKAANPLQRIEELIYSTEKRIIFCAESDGRREIIKEHLQKIDISPEQFHSFHTCMQSDASVAIVVADIDSGIHSEIVGIIVITEAQLFGERIQQKRRRKKTTEDNTDTIFKNLTELKMGSPVVHIEHGVGRYKGLQTIEHDGQASEFLMLEYANEAKLYVPVSSLQLISRYSGAEESQTPLHRLGSEQWQKAKRKAAEKVRDVAAELLDIYARRHAKKGFQYIESHDAYLQFSNGFPFEETPDQEAAIEAVRADMYSTRPMDRLVCGDVGFGKTEVAMRAAFIAVQNSKQVAVLVPTTLLAQQHYENFKDRFADWPVNIEVISRFKSTKEVAEAQKKLENGLLDIVIGTHKLIQGDIKFSNLGLVIIDEEHRFGVRQKEAFKALRSEVDILTMTATPIPRTLNMSMNGIRDLSIIATPPAKRLSVKTFVREIDEALVKEALLREILRGGQVYYLHNEVKSIEKVAQDIEKLVPEAKVRTGHGQMRERELENVMSDFYHKRFNVLVCTTIIETGIDIPTANTIIIDRADMFGLAQLHQLRGRVGRSHHQAYAYLFTPNRKNLTSDAVKRLDAIEEAQDLGAGFTLASHDLEIRGAGELLGDDQSGQMQSVGFTLYMDMLDRAVKSIQNGKPIDLEKPFDTETDINLRISALIPDDYLPDVHTRLTLYKRIASAKSDNSLDDIQIEMIDRFGLLPDAAKNLIRQTKLRIHAENLGISKIDANNESGRLEFSTDTKIEPLTLVKLIQSQPNIYKLEGANKLKFQLAMPTANDRLVLIHNLIDSLHKAS